MTSWTLSIVLLVSCGSLSTTASVAAQTQTPVAPPSASDRAAIAAAGLRDRVTIAGHVSDMPAAYLAADIVVSASTQEEAFGRVAAEASAMGRAVVATDHGGARETVLPGSTGLLVAPGDSRQLADALAGLVSAGAQGRAAMGARGRAHIARNYTVERMCADTIALYRELLRA